MRAPSLFIAVLLLGGCTEQKPQLERSEAATEAVASNTRFFHQFSSNQFPDKFAGYFASVTKKGSRNGLVFSQPTSERQDTFKDFNISGVINSDQLDHLLAALGAELTAAVENGGSVTEAGFQNNISDRPIYLLSYLFPDELNCGELRGFYLPYKQGELSGEIDVFVATREVGEQMETTIACAVHEVTVSAELDAANQLPARRESKTE